MRTIMMDVDGVLVSGRPIDGAHLFTDLERDLGIPRALLQREFFLPRWPAIVTGRRPLEPELADVLAVIAPDVSAETLIKYWFENDSRLDREVLGAITELRSDGRRVFLATNQEHRRASYLMNDMRLADHVDGIVYSAALGHRKPSAEFYELATAFAETKASDIVLIDDTQDNVLAARAYGWGAVHWKQGMTSAALMASVLNLSSITSNSSTN
ncbi:MAG: HAD family hydrolase [Mesorhizobium sp.]|uniref:HAD-IA family hydrolase n=1 Tax=Mesorhizobium sp. TaxID=1871066 RepID=UPI000FE82DCD|nr:HAD-IA family hydrolase [Mesorhizobium sp.]RWB06679.1 MAG: HAD family hydrolase [Mesorhizobium sp.]RWB13906.1 MAG: HAD family hydrolase [Mesorhizobium sp.]